MAKLSPRLTPAEEQRLATVLDLALQVSKDRSVVARIMYLASVLALQRRDAAGTSTTVQASVPPSGQPNVRPNVPLMLRVVRDGEND